MKKNHSKKENIKNKNIKSEDVKKEDIKNKDCKKINEKKYFGYTSRLLFLLSLFVLLLFLGILAFIASINFNDKKIINYEEKSNLNYKVNIYDNEFYDNSYLDKDMLYIASLIDKIDIEFDYQFETTKQENIDFNYKIVGQLLITNASGTKSFFEKEYTLLDEKKVSMNNESSIKIKEDITIDYSEYNAIANKFKNAYGIESESKLIVHMIVSKNTDDEIKINNESSMNVTIPLSEKQIEIKLDYKDINKSSNIIAKKQVGIINNCLFACSIVSLVISVFILFKIVKLLFLLKTKKSTYDKYINKILKEYDRVIVETNNMTSFENQEIIKINKFSELLDVHDNLQLPIIYSSINKHQKCYFYIKSQNIIYLLTIKAVDLDEK